MSSRQSVKPKTLNEITAPLRVGNEVTGRNASVLRLRPGQLLAALEALAARFGLTLDAPIGALGGAK